MRQRASIADVKKKIEGLQGKALSVSVNKGRKKTVTFSGEIVALFPSVFTMRSREGDILSFSYSDVICGDIRFTEIA